MLMQIKNTEVLRSINVFNDLRDLNIVINSYQNLSQNSLLEN